MISQERLSQIELDFNTTLSQEKDNFDKFMKASDTLKEYKENLELLKSEKWLEFLESIKDEKTNEEFRRNKFNTILSDNPEYINLNNSILLQEKNIRELDFMRQRYRDLVRFKIHFLEVLKNVE